MRKARGQDCTDCGYPLEAILMICQTEKEASRGIIVPVCASDLAKNGGSVPIENKNCRPPRRLQSWWGRALS